MKRISFVAPPFAGHLNPLLVLASAARDAGYAVTVITGPRKLDTVKRLGLEARTLRSIGQDSLESIANTAVRVGSNPVRLLRQFGQNLALLPAIRDELRTLWRAEPPHLVVADSVAPVAGIVCDEIGIPWITTIATPFAIENRRGVPAYCGGWSPGGWPGRDALGRFAIRTFKRSVALLYRREFNALGANFPYRADGHERIYSPYAILGFGIRELEFDRDWPPAFQMIGPVIDSHFPALPLNQIAGARRVLVTVGTHLLWAKRTLVGDVVRLSASFPDVEFHVSLGGEPCSNEQPAPRVAVRSFVPYERDLNSFDVILHHGGAGIAYAAILHGVPSVAVPQDYDQFDFAARIQHFRLGERAATFAGAGPALRRVLDRPHWPELQRMRDAARRYQPRESFLRTAEKLLQA